MDCRDEQIKLLTQTIEELRAELLKRDKEIAELKRHLGLNSNNSSKPPSSDGLKKLPRIQSLREKSDKKSGGQLGHEGTTLKQVENPDLIERHKISFCPHCSIDLTNEPVIYTCKKQVFDIPKIIKPIVTEHQFEIKCCPGCHKKVSIQNDGLVNAPVQYGPNVKALISYLNVYNFIPEGRTAEIMKDIFGITISGSTVENISKYFVSRVGQVVEQIEEHLKISPVKGADESGLRVAGKLHWLHVLCNDQYVHYRISEKRGDIKKDLEGVVVHDCFAPYYNKLEKAKHGLCGAHLLRELKAASEIDKEPWARNMARILKVGLCTSKQNRQNINTLWLAKHRKLYDQTVYAGLSFHESLGVLKQSVRGRVKRRIGHNLLLRLKNYADDVLRFLDNPEIPFTNNQAEGCVRMIKVKQKVSGCFRTVEGAKNFLTIRSYTATARKQGFNTLDALTNVFHGTTLSLS